ncbi:MAG: acyl carrier protein [Rhodobacteraceae bacterium]|jgi:acyl carrier protein|nr:acyl carrier protein [Paracoccaceae bacterium]MBL4558929.1 acyl carrier protein [Paracoccaceae bacterium]HBG99862.1 phosphopantetheine-binding protein [Paracoccaceae bacterium]
MTEEEIRRGYLEELVKVAPDIAPEDVGADDHLQDDLALDSMDVLNFVAALHERFGVDVPEREYPQIATLSVAIGYLGQRIGVAGRGGGMT